MPKRSPGTRPFAWADSWAAIAAGWVIAAGIALLQSPSAVLP
jgi:hypothetical protein